MTNQSPLNQGEKRQSSTDAGDRAAEITAYAMDMIGFADTLELMADNHARQLTGVASEMARQLRDRAAHVLAMNARE